ncbi:MAG: hypothetical protein GW808_07590 [Sphingomonadales bacterium]|nr:hypothetical protein [Sphingomonadales bacterium]NCO50141.1 hypothetical protein [Sphingomonadales bacterium]NCP01027.1 hypothetical protein [Sphingomonadales bacterium]NCP26386.1 hypothetical protein [Sphingomonadales bacterium]NCP43516.1 hypothetical protein [Sphingomonadales bacterium]
MKRVKSGGIAFAHYFGTCGRLGQGAHGMMHPTSTKPDLSDNERIAAVAKHILLGN